MNSFPQHPDYDKNFYSCTVPHCPQQGVIWSVVEKLFVYTAEQQFQSHMQKTECTKNDRTLKSSSSHRNQSPIIPNRAHKLLTFIGSFLHQQQLQFKPNSGSPKTNRMITLILDRIRLWKHNDLQSLWNEFMNHSREISSYLLKPARAPTKSYKLRSCRNFAALGEYSNAFRALHSQGRPTYDKGTIDSLKAKHPSEEEPKIDLESFISPPRNPFTKEEVYKGNNGEKQNNRNRNRGSSRNGTTGYGLVIITIPHSASASKTFIVEIKCDIAIGAEKPSVSLQLVAEDEKLYIRVYAPHSSADLVPSHFHFKREVGKPLLIAKSTKLCSLEGDPLQPAFPITEEKINPKVKAKEKKVAIFSQMISKTNNTDKTTKVIF
ncbi:hypothetical protein RFI_05514 [Reticulomyxa filosa]|uniref:Uncharacterized protein n=1 Tax=Reticulomyxa filosa TaxID=46433 RepID=X6NZ69_RETFI|nr:hypothetical protein RFI_05514 [Reticulomyxa filosa]|eukprot:ETO31605.1 hypothetical protein RFI_05514 [Reticulomyxa filosa]